MVSVVVGFLYIFVCKLCVSLVICKSKNRNASTFLIRQVVNKCLNRCVRACVIYVHMTLTPPNKFVA